MTPSSSFTNQTKRSLRQTLSQDSNEATIQVYPLGPTMLGLLLPVILPSQKRPPLGIGWVHCGARVLGEITPTDILYPTLQNNRQSQRRRYQCKIFYTIPLRRTQHPLLQGPIQNTVA